MQSLVNNAFYRKEEKFLFSQLSLWASWKNPGQSVLMMLTRHCPRCYGHRTIETIAHRPTLYPITKMMWKKWSDTLILCQIHATGGRETIKFKILLRIDTASLTMEIIFRQLDRILRTQLKRYRVLLGRLSSQATQSIAAIPVAIQHSSIHSRTNSCNIKWVLIDFKLFLCINSIGKLIKKFW